MKPWDVDFESLLRKYLNNLDPSQEISSEADLRALGLDSLATIQLVMNLEDVYEVNFDEDSLTFDAFATPEALWALVQAAPKQD